jgi:hypothetical protein
MDLRALEGRRVSVALHDGSRIDDCQLVAGPRGHVERVWVCVNGGDVFLSLDAIADAWEIELRPPRRPG